MDLSRIAHTKDGSRAEELWFPHVEAARGAEFLCSEEGPGRAPSADDGRRLRIPDFGRLEPSIGALEKNPGPQPDADPSGARSSLSAPQRVYSQIS